MSSDVFEELTRIVGPKIGKKSSNLRVPIRLSVTERLALTLRFLATGDSYHSPMFQFKISVLSISFIVLEVCDVPISSTNSQVQYLLGKSV